MYFTVLATLEINWFMQNQHAITYYKVYVPLNHNILIIINIMYS